MSEPSVEITHVLEFSASHRLHSPQLSDEENRELYGICNNPNGHGHNYVVEVTVRGPVPDGTGMVMDLNRLQRLILERLIEPVEHKHLNFDVPFLEGTITTAENVAVVFWRVLEPGLEAFRGARLHRVRVRESRMNYVDYYGPQAADRARSAR
jgi:6-pyruvoyltetrahydropterin/6-carboxytetrahydropterin synthase